VAWGGRHDHQIMPFRLAIRQPHHEPALADDVSALGTGWMPLIPILEMAITRTGDPVPKATRGGARLIRALPVMKAESGTLKELDSSVASYAIEAFICLFTQPSRVRLWRYP
jgi:hypothetical protein